MSGARRRSPNGQRDALPAWSYGKRDSGLDASDSDIRCRRRVLRDDRHATGRPHPGWATDDLLDGRVRTGNLGAAEGRTGLARSRRTRVVGVKMWGNHRAEGDVAVTRLQRGRGGRYHRNERGLKEQAERRKADRTSGRNDVEYGRPHALTAPTRAELVRTRGITVIISPREVQFNQHGGTHRVALSGIPDRIEEESQRERRERDHVHLTIRDPGVEHLGAFHGTHDGDRRASRWRPEAAPGRPRQA